MKPKRRFDVIECTGSAYEVGLQIGKGCRANITKALEMTVFGLTMMHHASKAEIVANAMKLYPQIQGFYPEFIERLRGLAEGAGISFEEAITIQCAYDLGGYYGQLSSMCTSFAVSGEASADGTTILGQTIDWFPGCPMDLIKVTHSDGKQQLSLVLWGVIEYTLSSQGFGICANGTWAAVEKYLFNIPVSVYLHKAMRQNNIDDAMSILQANARGLGYYHLASADHKIYGIESIQDDFELLAPQNDILVHSNHYLTQRFKPYDMAAYFVPDSPDRVERIRLLINEQFGSVTPEVMKSLLSDHDQYPNSICRHIDPNKPLEAASETLAAYIMVPEQGIMHIAWGNPCQYEFEEYSL